MRLLRSLAHIWKLAHRYYGTGAVFGKIMCIIIMVDYILLALLDYFQPRESLGRARKFNLNRWKKVSRSLADGRGVVC
jgi:phosphatidylinositol glycan class A protein